MCRRHSLLRIPKQLYYVSAVQQSLLIEHLHKDPIRDPTGHQTESPVRSAPLAKGRNSRNRAPSTGRLPPTPSPTHAYSAQTPTQVSGPADAMPKMAARKRVVLKANLRPMTSAAMPQKDAPIVRPTNSDSVVKRDVVSEMPNSTSNSGKVKATP